MVEILLLKLSFISIIEREGGRERERERERVVQRIDDNMRFQWKGHIQSGNKEDNSYWPSGISGPYLVISVTFEKGMSFTL